MTKRMCNTSEMPLTEQQHYQKLYAKEMKIMANLIHPNIVQFKGVLKCPLAILMEHVSFSFSFFGLDTSVIMVNTLSQFLSVLDDYDAVTAFREMRIIDKAALDVASGLQYLHTSGIVHRDLKPANILVSNCENNSILCKITDFGESRSNALRTLSCLQTRTQFVDRGTIPFEAPEQIMGTLVHADIRDLKKVDTWSFGQVMFCILNPNLRYPYEIEYCDMDKSLPRDIKTLVLICHQRKKLARFSSSYSAHHSECTSINEAYVECCQFNSSYRPTMGKIVDILLRWVLKHNLQLYM